MTSALVLTAVFAVLAFAALTALLIDRSARARAWRCIADERRWNHDRRDTRA